MSATNIAVLLAAASAAAFGAAVLRTVRGLRREVAQLRGELTAAADPADVPSQRPAPAAEIRSAVAQALADERERELAEARAFWAEQEAREDVDLPPMFLDNPTGFADDVFVPHQADFAGLEPLLEPTEPDESAVAGEHLDGGDSPELAAARRRHPSHPDFRPQQRRPDGADHERTVHRLEDLASGRTPLTDVRLGPLGTLDVYIFADGTTLCLSPGHRDTAERLAHALDGGAEPVLLGGSAVSGAFALTFDCAGDCVYILADRVIASL